MNHPSSAPVVVITGASSGIGAAAVTVFAKAGFDVVLAARRADKLATVAQPVQAAFPARKIIAIATDVTSDASVAALFEKVSHDFGKLNVLVNNAGAGVYGSVESTGLSAYQQNMETNYFGVIRCTQAALPLLRKAAAQNPQQRWGASIIMVSSIVGRRAIPNLSSYCATKFALEALSEALRVELHDERIAVSVVNPGITKTEFAAAAKGNRPKSFLQPKDGMTPEQVARVILNAARNPVRNRYLTYSGVLGVFAQWLSPRLVDAVMLRTWRKSYE